MIVRIRERRAFERLARDGQRIRRPALWCRWCPDPPSTTAPPSDVTPPTTAVAFALGRALGPAVTRNRLRRRLRAICRELDREGLMPGGLLMIGAAPTVTELTFDELQQEVTALVTATSPGRRSTSGGSRR